MPKKPKQRRRRREGRCRVCGLEREQGEVFPGGTCPSCLLTLRQKRRALTGARLLARARDAGSSEHHDGRTYQVVVLPPDPWTRR